MGQAGLGKAGMQERQILRNRKLRHHLVRNLDPAQQATTLTGSHGLRFDAPHDLVHPENLKLLT